MSDVPRPVRRGRPHGPGPRSLRAAIRASEGSMTVLTTGVLVVILLVMAVGAAITGVHLERNELQSAADSIALAAAQGVDMEEIYTAGDSSPITASSARAAAEEQLSRYPLDTGRTHDIGLDEVSVEADGTVRIVLSARTDPPLAGWFTRRSGTSIPLQVEGESRAR